MTWLPWKAPHRAKLWLPSTTAQRTVSPDRPRPHSQSQEPLEPLPTGSLSPISLATAGPRTLLWLTQTETVSSSRFPRSLRPRLFPRTTRLSICPQATSTETDASTSSRAPIPMAASTISSTKAPAHLPQRSRSSVSRPCARSKSPIWTATEAQIL
eukprot:Amastigsp_a841513_98.p3 type:complete len:156 gc:universal Amastigsp_a841513_98:2248-1781(-)